MAVVQSYDSNFLNLPNNYKEILKVEVRSNPASKNFVSITPPNYQIVGTQLITNTTYAEIKLTYKVGTETDAIERRVAKEEVDKKLNDLVNGASSKSYQQSANQYQEQYAGQNANIFLTQGQTIGGFQGLVQPIEENVTGVAQIFPIIATAAALKALKESSETSNSDLITGKSTTGGAPDVVIAGSSPKALNELYQGENAVAGLAGATPTEIKNLLKSTSLVPDRVDNNNISDVVNQLAGNQAITTATNMLSFINDPVGIFREVAGQNILPKVLGNISGLSTSGYGENLGAINSALPVLIDGFGNTNFNSSTYASGEIGKFVNQTTDVYQLGGSISTYNTSSHSFEIVDTEEEFKYEIANVNRDITAMMVHWSKTYNNQFLNASDMNDIHRALQEAKLGAEQTAALGQLAGIMWHYVILKDGTLQRGRPIELELLQEMPWSKHTIHIGFIAGYTQQYTQKSHGIYQPTSDSITDAQWKTFDMICKTIVNTRPGIGIFGHSDIHNQSTCPGFDVDTYVQNKFNYISAYTDEDLESGQALTAKEISTRVPYNTATTANDLLIPGPDVEKISVATTDSTISQERIDQAISEYNSLERQIETNDTQFVSIQNQVALNQYTTVLRNEALDTLFQLKETRKKLDDQLNANRVILINAGYVYKSEDEKWLKR